MKKDVLKVGTLIKDHDKIGVITKVIEVGQLNTKVPIISWRANYEITYIIISWIAPLYHPKAFVYFALSDNKSKT